MDAMTSVTKAAWQDLLACGKAGGLVQEPGNREIAWPAFGGAQQVGCLQGWEGFQCCGTQASSHYAECVINCHVNDAGVYTVTPDRCTVLCC